MALVTALASVRIKAGNPASTDDGDGTPYITDNFITDALSRANDNLNLAAAEVCDALAAWYAPLSITKSIGGTFNYGATKVAEHFREMAKLLRETAADSAPAFGSAEINPGSFPCEENVIQDRITDNEILRDGA